MLLHRVLRTLPWTVCLLVWAAGPPLAFGLTFTDDPLVPRTTTVKIVQITELRSDIDTVRTRLGLDAFSWTDPTLVAHVTPINRMHVIDFRAALDEAYQKAGKPLPTYSDATIVVGQTVVKVSHLNDARGVFRALFTPTITGPLHAGSRTVSGTGIPGSSVQLFVNGVARGAPAIVNALGQWTLSNLTRLRCRQHHRVPESDPGLGGHLRHQWRWDWARATDDGWSEFGPAWRMIP